MLLYRTLKTFLFLFLLSSCLSLFAQRTHVPGEILVKLAPGVTAQSWVKKSNMPITAGKKVSAPLNIYQLNFDPSLMDDETMLELVKQHREVEIAQFNHYVSLRSTIPNDPQYAQQWQYENTGQSGGTAGADIDMDLAWDHTTGGLSAQGDTIVVCVIDDGIFANHPDIAPNLWVNRAEIPNNGIDDDNNGFVDDYRGWDTGSSSDAVYDGGGHGSPVAGIVGAKGDNGVGVAGVNWNVKLMIVQGGTGVESEVLEAYSYPLVMRQKYNQTNGAEGAFVVATNASWGIDMGQPSNAPLWCAFYDTLGTYGILNAGATANAALDVDVQGDLPTACPSDYLISVTNMNHNDQKVAQAAWGLINVDLGAFGEGTHTVSGPNGYGGFGGTSGATPHVAGTIALLYAAPCPSLISMAKANPDQAALFVKQLILDGVEPNTSLAGITVTGGRLNVNNSMNLLMQSCGPCPPPAILPLSNVIDTMAQLNWQPSDSAFTTDLEWRMLGDSIWNLVPGLDSSYTLTGLIPCTTYEYQLISYCANDTSEFFSSGTFQTDGCCENPADYAVDSILDQSALSTWSTIFAAQAYQVRLREVGGSWNIFTTTDTSFSWTGLTPCTVYETEISVICVDDTVDFGQTQSFLTKGCGACLDLSYCTPPTLDASEEWIDSVIFNGEVHASGSNGGYGDFTETLWTTSVRMEDTVSIRVAPGFAFQTFSEYTLIWIDYNQDGDFEDLGETVFDGGSATPFPVEGEFIVPTHATLGNTRMRIFMNYDAAAPDACSLGADAFGEIEDYCITILPPDTPCVAPTALDTLDVSNTAILIGWDSVPDALGYLLEYKPINGNSWTQVTTSSDSVLLDRLDFCQQYEVQVKAFCGAEESVFSAMDTFQTRCATSIAPEFPEGSILVYPNPFSNEIHINIKGISTDLTLEVYSPLGQLMKREEMTIQQADTYQTELGTSELPTGIYVVRVIDQTGRIFSTRMLKRNE